MDFEWDENKNNSNIFKHGIDFNDAIQVFADPSVAVQEDTRKDYGERRFQAVGLVSEGLLLVVYTERKGNMLRIISARKANRKERFFYNPHLAGG
jgi:uncharacterized DUF497 family protein